MLHLAVATENEHKLSEMQAIFGSQARLFSMKQLAPKFALPEEGIESYETNAAQKAIYLGDHLKVLTLADDSGFEVEALHWRPGVLSARFANTKDSAIQRREILRQIENASTRRCRFVCVLALYDPHQKRLSYFRGALEGQVAPSEKGMQGFGYDSIVIPEGYNETLGEIQADVKNQISHRSQAIKDLLRQWSLVKQESL
jgi:XTP/dITP diphosphohydrolase